jgi:hypothetical protein
MFDLEQNIRSWRESFGRAFSERPAVLDELESHLREEMDRLIAAGESPERAWQIAVDRLGDPRELAREFANARKPGWVAGRLAQGALMALAALLAANLLWRLGHGRMGVLLASHIFALTVGYLSTLALGAAALAAIVSRARGNDTHGDVFRRLAAGLTLVTSAATLVGIILGACWSRANVGTWWQGSARELGALCVLGCNCAMVLSLRRRELAAEAAMIGAVIGNVVVIGSWFGPALVDPRFAQDLPRWYGATLLGAVMSQLLGVYAALMPVGWWRRARVSSGG